MMKFQLIEKPLDGAPLVALSACWGLSRRNEGAPEAAKSESSSPCESMPDSPQGSYLYDIVVQPTMLNCVPSDISAKRVDVPPLSEPKKSVRVPGWPEI